MPQSHFKPLQGGALAMLTLVLSLATFMLVLDSTIANVAIPTIAGDLGASSSQGTWVITSFGVANAISIPITGWLAKRFGEVRKRVESQKIRYFRKTVVFAYQFFAFFDFKFEIIIYYRFPRALTKSFA